MMSNKTMTRRELAAMATAGAAMATLAATPAAARPQPHMDAAMAALNEAKHQLEISLPNKGGHRIKAMAYVDAAIAEVQLGIQAGNQ